MRKPELAVIITSYQMPWHLERALVSVACQKTSRRLEVVVSDDGSRDETARMVRKFAASAPFPVRFVTHPHEGFHAARCRNEGVRHSTAPHLHFFDGDCLLPPDHLERHWQSWRPGITTCGYCARLDREVSERVTLGCIPSGEFTGWTNAKQRSALRTMHYKRLMYGLIGHRTRPAFISTDFSLSRADYERVNGFDENFRGWGCEDDDFGLRLRKAGVRMVSVLNRTFIYHLWHPPAPSRPDEWKRGANVAYLKRPIRLTRCLQGRTPRRPKDLTVQLSGAAHDDAAMRRLVKLHGWTIAPAAQARADIELVCRPGRGGFRGKGDCRVLAVLSDSGESQIDARQADVVLAPRGTTVISDKPQFALEDVGGLWAALDGQQRPQVIAKAA
jgi:GT2 family glycosyltransferase